MYTSDSSKYPNGPRSDLVTPYYTFYWQRGASDTRLILLANADLGIPNNLTVAKAQIIGTGPEQYYIAVAFPISQQPPLAKRFWRCEFGEESNVFDYEEDIIRWIEQYHIAVPKNRYTIVSRLP